MFTKYGLDTQEEELKAMPSVSKILEPDYGKEPESIYGVVENIAEDGITINKTMY